MAKSSSSHSSSEDGSDRSSSPESDQDASTTPVETLISGREKRTNAGNRLSRLIQEEEEKEDELTLLFEEDEQDVEFDVIEDNQSDEQLDSSSDEDDRGPNAAAGDEELDGERELQQQAKAERQKQKRKAEAMWKTPGSRKKVKIDPTIIQNSHTGIAQPKKKVERSSWTSTPDESALRSSSRRATVQNKQVVYERMKEQEARRLRQVASMEAAAKKKQKSRAKVMTQEDRLLEAARTEKINSKSLSRWEKDETKREAERRAKLAALHRRQMEGPVISWYSGSAEWINGTLAYVGRKPKKADVDDDGPAEHTAPTENAAEKPVSVEVEVEAEAVKEAPSKGRMDQENPATDLENAPQADLSPTSLAKEKASQQQQQQPESEPIRARPSIDIQEIPPYDPRWQIAAPPPPLIESSTRNLVLLQNFDPVTIRDRDSVRQILLKTKRGGGRAPSQCANFDLISC